MKIKSLLKNGLLQILGMVFFALGVALIVYAGVGASPIDAVANYSWRLSGIFSQGTWTTIWNAIFALIVLILTKKWKVFYALIVSVLIGFIIDLWVINIFPLIFTNVDITTGLTIYKVYNHSFLGIIFSYSIGILGLISLAIGISSLIVNKLLLTPYDEMSLYLETKTKKYAIAKTILDGSALLIAIILGLLLKDVWNQINLFTFVVVLGLGPVIAIFIKLFTKINKNNIKERV